MSPELGGGPLPFYNNRGEDIIAAERERLARIFDKHYDNFRRLHEGATGEPLSPGYRTVWQDLADWLRRGGREDDII